MVDHERTGPAERLPGLSSPLGGKWTTVVQSANPPKAFWGLFDPAKNRDAAGQCPTGDTPVSKPAFAQALADVLATTDAAFDIPPALRKTVLFLGDFTPPTHVADATGPAT